MADWFRCPVTSSRSAGGTHRTMAMSLIESARRFAAEPPHCTTGSARPAYDQDGYKPCRRMVDVRARGCRGQPHGVGPRTTAGLAADCPPDTAEHTRDRRGGRFPTKRCRIGERNALGVTRRCQPALPTSTAHVRDPRCVMGRTGRVLLSILYRLEASLSLLARSASVEDGRSRAGVSRLLPGVDGGTLVDARRTALARRSCSQPDTGSTGRRAGRQTYTTPSRALCRPRRRRPPPAPRRMHARRRRRQRSTRVRVARRASLSATRRGRARARGGGSRRRRSRW